MMKRFKFFLTAAVVALALSACDDDEPTPEVVKNYYELDGVEYTIDSTMFWYQAGMGGTAYIRLLTPMDGQDNPDLLKLYPNPGVNDLPGTYPWAQNTMMAPNPAGTYDVGYTADYAGMAYAWTSIGKDGSGDLTITEDEGVYHISGDMILSVGTWDFSTGEFTETGTKTLKLDYTGAITPL